MEVNRKIIIEPYLPSKELKDFIKCVQDLNTVYTEVAKEQSKTFDGWIPTRMIPRANDKYNWSKDDVRKLLNKCRRLDLLPYTFSKDRKKIMLIR